MLSIGIDKKLNLGITGIIITDRVKEQRPDMIPVPVVQGIIIPEQVDLGLLLVLVGRREHYPLLLGTIGAY